MTYALAAPLQRAIYARLSGDDALAAIVGTAVYDDVPAGADAGTFVAIGEEETRDRSDASGAGAAHDVVVSVMTGDEGFARAKSAAAAVSDAVLTAPLLLERGRVVSITFLRARARVSRDGTRRRIDLRFRARVDDDL